MRNCRFPLCLICTDRSPPVPHVSGSWRSRLFRPLPRPRMSRRTWRRCFCSVPRSRRIPPQKLRLCRGYPPHRALKRTFSDSTERLIRKVIDVYAPADKKAVPDELREFNIMFYSMAVGGLLEKYILKELNISSEKLIYYIEGIITKNAEAAA